MTTMPPQFVPLKAEFVPRRPGFVKHWTARFFVGFVRVYGSVFREVWPFNAWWPVPRLPFVLRLVLRHDDVRDVLARHDAFGVPFGFEMARLNDGEAPGTPFLLGDDDPATHRAQADTLMQVFPLGQDILRIARISYESAQRRLGEAANTKFDAIGELITAVPLDVCEQYLGIPLVDREERELFARASIELSGHLFGLPPIQPSRDRHEDRAGDYVRAIVDRAIALAIARKAAGDSGRDTAADRLVGVYGGDAKGRRQVRSVLIGMVVGFVPTNTMAGGYMLETLLRARPGRGPSLGMLDQTRNAAASGDDNLLERCLFEALRFKPINLGPFRMCRRDQHVGAVKVRAGERVLVDTSSAMFDSRVVLEPAEYRPGRPASNYLHFGFGMHWCIGAVIARTQLTQTFKALMLRDPQRASSLEYWGLFPYRLEVAIDGRTNP